MKIQASGQSLLHLRAYALEHGDRTHRHEEAACALRLLADHPVLEWDALVVDARLEATGAERREHRIAAVERGPPVGRRADHDVEAAGASHLVGKGPDQLEPVRVEVDEHHLRAVEVGAVRHERGHRAGGPRRAAAQVDELDPGHR